MKFTYRPDIDGLRAISIIGVILFHFKFDFFSGGYLGVDVFIVISGFLITSFIFTRLESNKFSFLEFLIRRAKRLLPTFFIVLFLSLIFAYNVFLPDDLVKFAKSFYSSTFLSSNFFFWLTSGYWDESNTNPLLHTWSLSLEWQFYLIFSLFSILMWKFLKIKSYKFIILIFIFIFSLSLFLSVLFMGRSMSFFLLPFRFYEFLIGSFIYFIKNKELNLINKNQSFISFLGLFFIILSFIIFDSESNAPGYIALIPCLGTAILIYQNDTIIHKMLKNKIFVYLGLISYSLYLYHWPVLIFYSWFNIVELEIFTKIYLIALSFILSAINYHTIEKIFKNGVKLSKYVNFAYLFFFIIAISFTYQIILNKGYPNRFSNIKNKYINSVGENTINERTEFLKKNIDLKFDKNKKSKILILGDSNGEDMFMSIRQNINENLFDLEYIKFKAWCFDNSKVNVLFKYFKRIERRNLECIKQKNIYDKNIKLFKDADYILLSSSWFKGIDKYITEIITFIKSYSDANLVVSSKTIYFPHISNLIKRLDDNKIKKINNIAYETKFRSVDKINKKLENAVKNLNINYLDKTDLICSNIDKKCHIYDFKNNVFYVTDNHHWTLQGAKFFGKKLNIEKIFNKLTN